MDLTHNHLVRTPGGVAVKRGDAIPGDRVMLAQPKSPSAAMQVQVILGALMGDGEASLKKGVAD